MSRRAAWRGSGTPPASASSTARVPGPDTRTTAIAEGPGPLASATMVSGVLMDADDNRVPTHRRVLPSLPLMGRVAQPAMGRVSRVG